MKSLDVKPFEFRKKTPNEIFKELEKQLNADFISLKEKIEEKWENTNTSQIDEADLSNEFNWNELSSDDNILNKPACEVAELFYKK
ncbi:hypothetical protein ECANGB1_129 [Enterospora canceri]|uniref:Uncharacterized protein n=1 Tax=Enterospora canceri TaxID=1081671 RepID=A0A1Y1S889_9MICR|nr:hypothetical protein ECANGB1_129 [Enterospora canceri]